MSELANTRAGQHLPRTGGFAQGEIWLADDWDSPEVDEEIAQDFHDAVEASESSSSDQNLK